MNTMSVTKYYSNHATMSKIIPINDYPEYIAQGYKRTPMHTVPAPTPMPTMVLGDPTADYFYGLMLVRENLIRGKAI